MTEDFKVTDRGFKIYGELTDSYDTVIRVQESSAVGDPRAWIFCNNPEFETEPSPHLSPEQAIDLIRLLQKFVADARDEGNWRNDPSYRKAMGVPPDLKTELKLLQRVIGREAESPDGLSFTTVSEEEIDAIRRARDAYFNGEAGETE